MVPDTEEVAEQYNARNSSRSGVGVVMKRKNSSVVAPEELVNFREAASNAVTLLVSIAAVMVLSSFMLQI